MITALAYALTIWAVSKCEKAEFGGGLFLVFGIFEFIIWIVLIGVAF